MLYRHFMIVFVLVSLLAGCSTAKQAPEPLRVRVLSYNIHHGEGTDGRFDLERLADIINRADPDLVALQEVDVETRRSKGVDQAARLAELTGMHHSFAEAMAYDGGGYGEAVLSRYPIDTQYNHKLPYAEGQEPRSAAVVSVRPRGKDGPTLVFAGTHLCHLSGETRLNQARSLINHQAYDGPMTILAGDFNFTPDTQPYRAMIDAGWADAAASFGNPQPTIPSDDPKRRIDYVFARPANAWRVVDVQVLDEPIASDHAPVLVELEYVFPR